MNELYFVLIANAYTVFGSSILVTLSLASKEYHFAWYSPSFLFDFEFTLEIGSPLKIIVAIWPALLFRYKLLVQCFVEKFCMKESFKCREVFHCYIFNVHGAIVKELIHKKISKRNNPWQPTTSFFCNSGYFRELISLDYYYRFS